MDEDDYGKFRLEKVKARIANNEYSAIFMIYRDGQKAVTVYFISEHLLLLDIAEQSIYVYITSQTKFFL